MNSTEQSCMTQCARGMERLTGKGKERKERERKGESREGETASER